MITRFFFTIFFVISLFFKSQQAEVIIEYDYNINILNFKAYLISDNKQSFFFFDQNRNNKLKDLVEANYKQVNPFFIFNYHFVDNIMMQTLPTIGKPEFIMANDRFPDVQWNIKETKRKILNYNCTLAEGDFRGSKFSVWFTTEISSNAFPWKLRGLPGLILAFEEKTGLIKGEATHISLNIKDTLPISLIELFNKNKNKAVSYSDFIVAENKQLKENMNAQVANLPVGTKYVLPELREKQLEKIFEWEVESKKP